MDKTDKTEDKQETGKPSETVQAETIMRCLMDAAAKVRSRRSNE